jgi:Lar family restriction alleviation protein
MSELKPCPFCGSTDIKLHDEISHAVWCQECFAEVPSIDIESAIKLWNTRPIEDALTARIAELEAENEKINYFFKKLRMFCIFAHWDNPNTEAEFYKVDAEIREYLSEYKVCIDQLTAHDATERQDDKSSNDTQKETFVYGKDSKPIPDEPGVNNG